MLCEFGILAIEVAGESVIVGQLAEREAAVLHHAVVRRFQCGAVSSYELRAQRLVLPARNRNQRWRWFGPDRRRWFDGICESGDRQHVRIAARPQNRED